MKKIISSITFTLMIFIGFGQAPIPTSWDCTDVNSLPTGYSIGPVSYLPSNYANLGVGNSPSLKLNGDDQYLTIQLAGEAGEFTYWIKGTNPPSPPGQPFDGQFDIQVSDNGTSWTTLRSLVDAVVDVNNIQQYTDTVLPTTRYIRFYFTRKESGFNISLDDIYVGVPVPRPEAEINAVIDNDTVFSGGSYYTSENVSSTKRVNIIIENQGLDSTLSISSVNSSNASEFAVTSFPTTIDSLSSDTIKIDFTPSAAGTRTSTITITNNDNNESSYIINLIGYGNGFATEPNAPSSVTFSNVVTYDYDVHYSPNSPLSDEGYIAIFQKGTAPVSTPIDGMDYNPGDMIGGAKVAYIGTDTLYSAKEVWANSTYYVAVFAYSGNGPYRNYSSVATTNNITTPITMMPSNYYNSVNSAVSTFVPDLHALVSPHTLAFYSDFDDTYIAEFASRDTTNGQLVVTCRYTSDEYLYSPPFSFSYISREHSFPQSWMPTWGDQSKPEYNDYHNLFPVNQAGANAVRSNYPLGEVATISSVFLDGTLGQDTAGNDVYEPRDSHKGDAARAMFYMSIAYTSISGNLWALPDTIKTNPFQPGFKGQDQDVLKKWHWQDPVDEWEIARNDYIESVQGNRNPFIDSMEYVCFIDFMSMTRVITSAPCTFTPVGIDESSGINYLKVYPNPTNNILNVSYEFSEISNKSSLVIKDIIGKNVSETIFLRDVNGKKLINVESLPQGVYFLSINSGKATKSMKFVKN